MSILYDLDNSSIDKLNRQEASILGSRNVMPDTPKASQTVNGVEFTMYDDGTININGTPTNTFSFNLLDTNANSPLVELRGSYIFTTGQTTIPDGGNLSLELSTNPATYLDMSNAVDGELLCELTDEVHFTGRFHIYSVTGRTVWNNYLVKPMLRIATDPNGDFVPYAMTNRQLTKRKLSEIRGVTSGIDGAVVYQQSIDGVNWENKVAHVKGWENKADSTNAYLINDTELTDEIEDADYIPLYDKSTNKKKHTIWSKIKAKLETYFNTKFMRYLDKYINKMLTGSGVAGQDKGANVSPRYYPAKWTYNTGSNAVDGNVYTIKIPSIGGHAAGVYMSTDNGSHYYPVVTNSTSRVTTHFPANTCVTVIFESGGSAATYPINGGDSTTTVTGGVFRIINYYDSNSYVTQTATSANANYEVLFSVTADNTTRTEGARKNSNLKFNPSTGNLVATKFTGNLQATTINGATVGSTPKFTDTNNAVTQSPSNANGNYRVLFSNSASNTEETGAVRKYSNLLFNPSTGTLTTTNITATKVNGVTVGKYITAKEIFGISGKVTDGNFLDYTFTYNESKTDPANLIVPKITNYQPILLIFRSIIDNDDYKYSEKLDLTLKEVCTWVRPSRAAAYINGGTNGSTATLKLINDTGYTVNKIKMTAYAIYVRV